MNYMRHGFTMIELIFVIVIIGTLSAVAIPKLVETTKEAHNMNVKSFVGSMNRTVGTTMWTTAVLNGGDGLVDCANLANYIDLPSEVTHAGNCAFTVVSPATGAITFNAATNPKAEAPQWTYAP